MLKILQGDPEDITTVCGETFFAPAPCRHCADLHYVPMMAETAEGQRWIFACRSITTCGRVEHDD